jgi:GT2 family glycosyltransferase
MTDLSIIIVSYRGWNRLFKCLDSIKGFGLHLFSYEVIVVDNRSDDGVFEKCPSQYPGFIFIQNALNGGFGNGCNLGADKASGDYLLFLNPDTVVSETAIMGLLLLAKGNSSYTLISCIQPDEKGKLTRVHADFPSPSQLTGWQRSLFKNNKKAVSGGNGILFPDWVSGSVMLISNKDFSDTGKFDDDYWMYYEDVDLCKRIADRGGKVVVTDKVSIEHNHGGSSRVNVRTTGITKCEVMISQHLYISKHFNGTSNLFSQVFLVTNNIITGLLSSLAGLLLFFNRKMFARVIIFGRLISYYLHALSGRSWISPRSVNHL